MASAQVDALLVEILQDRAAVGEAAAAFAVAEIGNVLGRQSRALLAFAAAPSQEQFLSSLAKHDVPWARIDAVQLDEYVGLAPDDSRSFGGWLRRAIFDHVRPGSVELISGMAPDLELECARYSDRLSRGIDVAFLGVGENGHVAFNEPGATRFDDVEAVRVVELDAASRLQQVHDRLFDHVQDVPSRAVTLTMSALLASRCASVVVVGQQKASAVRTMLTGRVDPSCPASGLRLHPNATLFLDESAASLL